MRIGIVCPYSFDEPGGVQAHILDLARILRKRGHHVAVLGPATQEAELPEYVMRGGGSIPIPYNGSVARLAFGPQVFRNVRAFVQRGNFDVLHIHEPNSPSYSMAAMMCASGPLVATYHASASGSRLLKCALPVLRPYLEKIRGGIAVSEMARRWQVEQLGGDPVLIPNGVDTKVYHQARKDDRTPGTVPEIVFLGRIDEPRKGLDILLHALHGLSQPVKVTVIGGGKPRTVPGVDFVGRVSDAEKAEILGRADIYVAPNTGGESFGIVLVEAMAAGCAVVASDLEAFSAVCDAEGDNPAGVLFKNGSAEDLREKLELLLRDSERRAGLVNAGLKRAHRYDWSTVADDVFAVYETVADGSVVEVR
ncbi:glycosyltransferase family 4 protein [Corynebacterium lowii]|uniref:GDP-mannose-dependent alpha-(1-2)-phosphatidylinositol mannosyltransferase n=1 Tax=Corynebacterium lowii TaxID=1544413 RepID=A0A0Q0U3L3_9CORY|nr:glycosyltransferase family 4 protein [Corynebacterium lowii]KQB86503.1 GDP-mannose-dependent alpha-(1-2)-phosphatidylinositol mannosyltransferase [Corynebacterium lowii]MDP9851183.1 phosphatidylinositol alpha-mannosyltransferase [Corynebacterium lowii]